MSILDIQALSKQYMTAALSSKHPKHLGTFNFYSPKILTQSSTPRQSQIDVSHDIYVMYHAPHDLDNRNGTGNLEQTVKFSKTETNSVSIKTTDGVKTGSDHTWRGNLDLKLNFKVADFGGVSGSYQYKKNTENNFSTENTQTTTDSQTWEISSKYTVKPGVKETLDFYILGTKTQVMLDIYAEFQGTHSGHTESDSYSNAMAVQDYISQTDEVITAYLTADRLANSISGYSAPNEFTADTSRKVLKFKGTATANIQAGVKCIVVVNGTNSITGETYSYIHPKTMVADGSIEYLEDNVLSLLALKSILV